MYTGFPLFAVKNDQGSAYLCWKTGRNGIDQTVVYTDSADKTTYYDLQPPSGDGVLQLTQYGDSKECNVMADAEGKLVGWCGAAFPALADAKDKWVSPLFFPAMKGEDVNGTSSTVAASLTNTDTPDSGSTSTTEDRKPLDSLPEGDLCRYLTSDMVAAAMNGKWDPSVSYIVSPPEYEQTNSKSNDGSPRISDSCTVQVRHPQDVDDIGRGKVNIYHSYKVGTESDSGWDGSQPTDKDGLYTYDGRMYCEVDPFICSPNPAHKMEISVQRPSYYGEPNPNQDSTPEVEAITVSVEENLMTQFLDRWQADN